MTDKNGNGSSPWPQVTRWPPVLQHRKSSFRRESQLPPLSSDFVLSLRFASPYRPDGFPLQGSTHWTIWIPTKPGETRGGAGAMLGEIYNWFTEGFDTADLKDAKALLEELSE
jgi:hypothetical protein